VAMHRGGSTTSVNRGGMTEHKNPTAAEAAGCLHHQQPKLTAYDVQAQPNLQLKAQWTVDAHCTARLWHS